MTPGTDQAVGFRPWSLIPGRASALFRDLPIIAAGLALFYGLLSLARYWTGTVAAQPEIHLNPGALPRYALFSLARLAIGYVVSLVVTLVYAYVAAHNRKAE